MLGLLGTNIPVGSLFNIPIKVNVLLPLFTAFQIFTFSGAGWKGVLYAFIAFGPIVFSSSLASVHHDAGQKADLWVTFAGPLTHIPQAGIWFAIAYAMDPSGFEWRWPGYDVNMFGQSIVWTAFGLNILFFAFNLFLPAYPLDGGRILVDGLLLCGVPATTTAYITIALAVTISLGLIVCGALQISLFNYGGIMIGIFILLNTYNLYQALDAGQIEQHPLFKIHGKDSSGVGQPMTQV